MRIARFTFSFWALLTFAGCTKGSTNFNTLDVSAVPMPLFSGQTTLGLIDVAPTQTNVINGECDSRIHQLLFSATGTTLDFTQPANFTVSGLTLNCGSTGTFSLTLKSLTDLGFTIATNTSYSIQVRALTDGGISNPSTINILYSNADLGPRRIQISSGANLSGTGVRLTTSTSFKAEVRVGHMVNNYSSAATAGAMAVKSSTDFSLKGGIAADHD